MSVHSSDSLDWPGLELHVAKEFREETLLNLDHRPLGSWGELEGTGTSRRGVVGLKEGRRSLLAGRTV